ncbi:MAG: DUF2062 domain-containing protein [Betaproteobacteria bacterium]|nr:DUF2062 domain-containing protein [Betaproteobacteria bacterium]
MLERLRSHIPTREQIVGNRWLRWLAPYLGHPRLWHWSRRGVAIGVGIGVFFGLLIPVAQIPLSAVAAVVLRANIPAAAASTLVTNPVTFAPVYYAAYKLGAWVTGANDDMAGHAGNPPEPDPDASFWQRIANLGMPLLVGLSITATVAGLASYALISLGWYLHVMHRRRQRTRKQKP